MAKFPCGFYAETKYDGERVQVHAGAGAGGAGGGGAAGAGMEYAVFSRSLNPAKDDKVCNWAGSLGRAFPGATSVVLDCEVLMVDTKEGVFLPFGTLGSKKRHEHPDAQPCIVVFDMLMHNGESMLALPLAERRRRLVAAMTPVRHLIMLSAAHDISSAEELGAFFSEAVQHNEEGVMIKDRDAPYEPGKRRWFKLKRDYIVGANRAESVDLAVLGAYHGRGAKGGMLSAFLMGCRDGDGRWRAVAKVGNGYSDEMLAAVNATLCASMVTVGRGNAGKAAGAGAGAGGSKAHAALPPWLVLGDVANMVPDFVIPDPDEVVVWEILGAEFTKSKSGAGVSIRHPRFYRVRDDKDLATATTLSELHSLHQAFASLAPRNV